MLHQNIHKTTKKTLNIAGKLLDLSLPRIMGVLNITPDSFYANSRTMALEDILQKARQMADDGATFIDIGGYSTRPNADDVPGAVELERVLPAIEALKKHLPDVVISVDTFRANVARQAVAAGAGMINDVSGGTLDAAMFETVAQLGVPYVLMHLRGNPKTMTQLNHYQELTTEVIAELQTQMFKLQQLGSIDIMIDPGFGFAKNANQNFELLSQLENLEILERPILVGISRKSMIWRTLQIQPDEALNGTTVLNTVALLKGASILRVHDVRQAVEAVKLVQLLKNN